ncbi:ATP-dependent DNA helicase RecG [Moorella sp. Hama-1]|uniref:ATP-dependent DNA helicase RecG n=1 Tax=Moorella sp. Hama-1 TaxID=2138101 RepID=UPI000D64E7A4|nr:ATP-dependent DNA helicase RecG [Moorella sp. Hama-1]MDN5361052.1 ATP-dependent helicase RecG [Moorella sp. (in: firmicutes)]BCV20988.1 ATP-dependent DNA helicase RecG [Moorella sp. Hama-1]
MILDRPVATLKYVGSQKAARLHRLGIATVGDLLWHFPRRYEDRRQLKDLAAVKPGETVTVQVTIRAWEEKEVRPRLRLFRALIQGRQGTGFAVWFNQPYLQRQLPVGTTVIITGRVNYRGYQPEIQVSDYEVLGGGDLQLHTGRIVPFYPLTAGLSQRWLRLVIHLALEAAGKELPEVLPPDLSRRYRLLPRLQALHYIHFPPDAAGLHQARRRLKYEELLLWELGLNLHRVQQVGNRQGIAHSGNNELITEFIASLPFKLTAAQERVLAEILADMEAPRPMARLLQGDVGSGKTVVAAAAMLKALAGGWQAALMAPTEVLAEQHGRTLGELLAPLGVPVATLTGNTPRAERETILRGLAGGQLPLVVGTHALIQAEVSFKALGLAVIDEQHRFGVDQRAALQAKGEDPDLLVMTATPIPRTLALAVYGDLDISTLDELPPGRQPVTTYVITEKQRRRAYHLIDREIRAGHQAYVICPLIDESETVAAEAAIAMARKLQEEVFPAYPVGLVHGRLRPAEKEGVMADFREGRLAILVATTVVEVGVDVPNATVMLIEGAERLGLAQLHQLRGRVGRGTAPSYCFLIAGDSQTSRERLAVLANSQDGFAIAEADLRLRGPGEFFGTRQHGLPEFRLARLPEDGRILEQARLDARQICQQGVSQPWYQDLYRAARGKMESLHF